MVVACSIHNRPIGVTFCSFTESSLVSSCLSVILVSELDRRRNQ